MWCKKKKYFFHIAITVNGNCLYNSISYYLYGNEESNRILRNKIYEYVIRNKTLFYEYAYEEKNKFYIDIHK